MVYQKTTNYKHPLPLVEKFPSCGKSDSLNPKTINIAGLSLYGP